MLGYVIVLPCIDRWVTVDLRTKAFSVPPQMVRMNHFALFSAACYGNYRVWQKSSPLKFFTIFSTTGCHFNLKFYTFIF